MNKAVLNVRGGARLSSIDCCKAIAAVCVVLIHFGFPGMIGSSMQAVCRWAVPYFFMVSGYFAYSDNWDNKRIAMKSLRIAKMALVAVVIYLLYNIATDGVASIISELSIANIVKLVVFNAPQVSSAHLWFLFALIYCYLLLIATHRLLNTRLLKLYIVAALTLHILIAEIIPTLTSLTFAHPIVRNAYLFGYPFFLIGYYIRKDESLLNGVKNFYLIFAAIIGAVLAALEHAYVLNTDLLELYVGAVVMSISIFALSVKMKSTKASIIISHIGENYSMIIYIAHPIVGDVMIRLFNDNLENTMVKLLLPIAVIVVSLMVAIIVENFINSFRNLNKMGE